MINIRLFNQIPISDGYYIMKFNQMGGIHLALITTFLDGERKFIVYTDEYNFDEKQWFSDKLNIMENV